MLRLLHGDCTKLMNGIPSESVDLIVTDPPYTMTKRGKSCRPRYMPNNIGNNVFDGDIPLPSIWFSECYRVLKNDTHFYTFCNINDLSEFLNVAAQVGFKLHNVIVMIKDTKMPNRWYLKYSEMVLFFRKGKAKPINDLTSRDYMYVKMPTRKNGKVHITQKPLDFITKLVINSSDEDDIVLDPFMGSGTTGVAAIKSNRDFIGIEINKKYYDVAVDRINGCLKENDEHENTRKHSDIQMNVFDFIEGGES